MKKFFTQAKKLEHKHLLEIAGMCAAAMLLLAAAVFVSSGGMGKFSHFLAVNHITPGSQAGCVFHCNNGANDMEELVPMQGGVPVSSVLPGTAVSWIWNAGTYGANNFNPVCKGSTQGSGYMCTVNLGSPDTNFANCQAPICTSGSYDSDGNCIGGYTYGMCGNADDRYGHTSYGASGGYPPNYVSPGYDGNITDSLILNAPSTPGTYTYYFCSYYLLHANTFNSNLTALPCLGTDLVVSTPPATCPVSGFASPWDSTSYLIYPGGQGSISNWYGRYCVHNYSGSYIYIPMATPAEWNNFSAGAGAVGIGINAY